MALGLSILIFTDNKHYILSFRFLFLFEFPAKIVERHYPSKLSCVYFWISRSDYNCRYFKFSCCSSVTQLSSVFSFELPATVITVISALILLKTAVSRVSFNCRLKVFIFCGRSKNSLLFPFQFLQYARHVWKHVWKSYWRLSPCRRLFQAESRVVSLKLMLILWSDDWLSY